MAVHLFHWEMNKGMGYSYSKIGLSKRPFVSNTKIY